MPKIKNETVLADNPNSIYAASKNIRTIALKNLDNPAEEPSLPSKSSSIDDKTQSKIDEFNGLILDLSEFVNGAINISNFLSSGRSVRGDRYEGMGMSGGAFSKNITSHTVPTGIGKIPHRKPRVRTTAESFKSRYPTKYSQYNYSKTGLDTNANFVGAGRRRRKMKGGADPEEDYGDLYDVEIEDLDEEDEDSTMTPDSLDAPAGRDRDDESGRSPSQGDVDEIFAERGRQLAGELGGDFSYGKFLDALTKASTVTNKAKRFFASNVKKNLRSVNRSVVVEFIENEKKKLDEIDDEIDTLGLNARRIVSKIEDVINHFGIEQGKEVTIAKNIANRYNALFDNFGDLYREVTGSSVGLSSGVGLESNVIEPEQGRERIREGGYIDYRGDYTGVNTSEDLRRIKEMSGGARGGVPILSSLASSYRRIPTKYLL